MRYSTSVVAGILAAMLPVLLCAGEPKEVVVHRGANRIAPENTLAAGRACIALGADFVEIDVRRSSDGVHYVLHDQFLDRTTDGTGRIDRTPSCVVDTLDAGSWFSETFAGEPVPRVDDYLRMANGRIRIYFDVKDADLPALAQLVRSHRMQDQCFFWFGDNAAARRFKELAPDLPLKINVRTPADAVRAHDEYGAKIVEMALEDCDEEMRATCTRLGLRVMIYEPGTGDNFRRIIHNGDADMVNLDDLTLYLELEREEDPQAARQRAALAYGTAHRVGTP